MKDQSELLAFDSAVNVTAVSANGTTTGNVIDLKGYDSATFVLATNARTDGTYTIAIFDGDASDALTEVAANKLVKKADGGALSVANAETAVGYVGGKRYAQMRVVATAVTTGAGIRGIVVLGNPDEAPTA